MPHLSSDAVQRDLAAVGAALRAVTVVVRSGADAAGPWRGPVPGGQGSGIVWSADGTIVTNAHVAVGEHATVTLADGRTAEARVVARDRRRDVAVLRAAAGSLGTLPWPAASLGDPASLRAGELVVALGHPLGVEHALAVGVVHAAPRGERSPYVHADVRLAPGNSGGPLADARGRVVGVNSMIVGGLGVALSVDAVRDVLAAAAPRPSLGVRLRAVRVRVPARAAEPPTVGMLVLAVDAGGAAARAGVLQGDLLLGHAGRPFRAPGELTALLRDAGAGGVLRLDVGRGGRRETREIHLGAAVAPGRRAA